MENVTTTNMKSSSTMVLTTRLSSFGKLQVFAFNIYYIYGYCSVQKKKKRILMISANSELSSQKYCTFIYLLVSYELQLSNNASLFPCQVVVQEKHTLFIAQVCATDLHNVQF